MADARVPDLPPLLDAVLGVGTDLELRTTLRHIADAAAELTGARRAAVGTTGPGPEHLVEVHGADRPGPPEPDRPGQPDADRPGQPGADRPGQPDTDRPGQPDADHPGQPSTDRPGQPDADRPGQPSTDRPGRQDTDLPGQPGGPGVLEVPIRVGEEVSGRLYVAEKRAGGPFTAEDELLLHALAVQAGIAIGNARLYETARRRERWIEGAAAVTTALLAGDPAADALTTVADRARVLADAAAGVVLQPTAQGGMEVVTASTPDDPGAFVGTTIEPGHPVLARLLGGEAVFVDDPAADPRTTTPVGHRFGPSMMLPLQAGGRLIGTLALPRRRGAHPYTPEERLLATQFASQAALALVLADAGHRRERLAVYEDRDRIARDLHDLVVQRLFATGLMVQAARRRSDAGDTGDVGETLGRAVDELESTIEEVRTAILALQQPPAEAPATVRGRVLREAAGLAAVLGRRPSVRFTGAVDSRVPDRVAGQLLAALRRALAATARRTAVSRVEITVDVTATLPDGREGVRLTVHDDGTPRRGGDPDGHGGGGGSGGGTTVTWQSPL
ncbi:GAF domain-containing protein [Streptomyces adustus]|uniref:GAF domain-containing protein n=1 Tax=Streptomyces adustus TaxID=1609272 RepID=A0A5N8VJZ4_9ACTN|nr:GAF domain-containing protein [Streptomyces adustus]MPY35166.1 GAF domain-containing protein [Streptomyces adustus]